MARNNTTLGVAFLLLFGGFIYVIHDQFEQHVVEPGERAPSFRVTTESGQKITASDFGGKLLVLNFWATWCPPCVEEMPSLNQFAQTMSADGVVVLGVSIDRNEKAYKNFIRQNRLAFQTARDPAEDVSSSYGSFKWPETYVIGREGKVLQKYIGKVEWMDPEVLKSMRKLL